MPPKSVAPSRPVRPPGTPAAIVCVVDPDAATQAAVRERLAVLGATVRTYESGASLLAELDRGLCPAAAIVDTHLPDMSGLELLQRLAGRAPAVPTIMLTREADVATAVSAMRAGALDYIEKPQIDRALLKHIGPLLAGHLPPAG